jgi:hypothetical protein
MKDFLTILSTYKGYIGLLFGIGSIVFAYGVKSATKEISSKSSVARIENWITYDSLSHEESKAFQGNVILKLNGMSDSLGLIFNNQHTLTNAVGTIGSKVTNTVPELFKLMGGLQFELVQSDVMKSVFPETKIKIMKVDTIKK